MDTSESASVYLASPLGFTAAGRYWYEHVLLPAVQRRGLIPFDPWTNGDLLAHALSLPPGVGRELSLKTASREVAARNFEMIQRSAAVLAVLDGTDVDSGTATEMGYALALGIPVYALRTDTRKTGEHELAHVNIQVEECVYASGGIIGTDLAPVLDAIAERIAPDRAPGVEAVDDDAQGSPRPEGDTTRALRSLLQSMPSTDTNADVPATASDAAREPGADDDPTPLAPAASEPPAPDDAVSERGAASDATPPTVDTSPAAANPSTAAPRAPATTRSPARPPQKLGRFTRVPD